MMISSESISVVLRRFRKILGVCVSFGDGMIANGHGQTGSDPPQPADPASAYSREDLPLSRGAS
jgi:hypothetical protein